MCVSERESERERETAVNIQMWKEMKARERHQYLVTKTIDISRWRRQLEFHLIAVMNCSFILFVDDKFQAYTIECVKRWAGAHHANYDNVFCLNIFGMKLKPRMNFCSTNDAHTTQAIAVNTMAALIVYTHSRNLGIFVRNGKTLIISMIQQNVKLNVYSP